MTRTRPSASLVRNTHLWAHPHLASATVTVHASLRTSCHEHKTTKTKSVNKKTKELYNNQQKHKKKIRAGCAHPKRWVAFSLLLLFIIFGMFMFVDYDGIDYHSCFVCYVYCVCLCVLTIIVIICGMFMYIMVDYVFILFLCGFACLYLCD